jgi:hypothetical protein
MIESLLDKPVDLEYRNPSGAQDDYGQPVGGHQILPGVCYFSLMTTDDMDAIAREQLDVKVYLPVTTDTFRLQAVIIDGARFEVQGTPFRQWNPRTRKDAFWVLSVRRAES